MKTRIFSVVILAALALYPASSITAQVVVDFEDVTLSTPDSFVQGTFDSGGVTFEGARVGMFDTFQGYVASNATVNQDLSISPGTLFGQPDFELQQYSAYVPDGGATSNYGVLVFANSDVPRTASRGAISAPEGTQFESIKIANTTFAAHSILVGDDFATAFDDSGSFTLFIEGSGEGFDATEISVPLAVGRDVLDEFLEVSLEALSGADEISFSLESSAVNGAFQSTPTYIAIDDLTFAAVAVPEPNSVAILGLSALTALLRRRKS